MEKNFEAYRRELADRLLTSNRKAFAVRKTGGIMDCTGNPKHRKGIFGITCCNNCIFQESPNCVGARRDWLMENYKGEIEMDKNWDWCPIGMPLLVRNQKDEPWQKGWFATYKNGKIYAYPFLTTTSPTEKVEELALAWNYAKIAS